jgi:hypothetical protein
MNNQTIQEGDLANSVRKVVSVKGYPVASARGAGDALNARSL